MLVIFLPFCTCIISVGLKQGFDSNCKECIWPFKIGVVFSRLKDWFGHETIINMKEQQTIRVIE